MTRDLSVNNATPKFQISLNESGAHIQVTCKNSQELSHLIKKIGDALPLCQVEKCPAGPLKPIISAYITPKQVGGSSLPEVIAVLNRL